MRRRNDEFIAEVLMAIDAGAFPNKKEGLDKLFVTFERRGVPPERLSEMTMRLGRALAILDLASARLRKTRFRNKSDCYSLLILLARNAEHLSAQERVVESLVRTLSEFSNLVNRIKRLEGQGKSVDDVVSQQHGTAAQAYLRAVERAASDRLSRVRRDEALETVLKEQIAASPSRPLGKEDESWRLDEDNDAEEVDASEWNAAEDRESMQQTLLSESDL